MALWLSLATFRCIVERQEGWRDDNGNCIKRYIFRVLASRGCCFVPSGIIALVTALRPNIFITSHVEAIGASLAFLILCINFYARTIFQSNEYGGLKVVCALSVMLSWFLITLGFIGWAPVGASIVSMIQRFQPENYIWIGVAVVLSILLTACPMLARPSCTAGGGGNVRALNASSSCAAPNSAAPKASAGEMARVAAQAALPWPECPSAS